MATGTQTRPQQGRLALTLANLRCRLERDGPRALLAKIARALGSRLYCTERVVVMSKDLTAITDMTFDEAVLIEEFGEGHLEAMAEFNRRRCNTSADDRAKAALARGYRGFVGYVSGELVGYYWWVDGEIEPRHADIERYGLDIELQPGEVYGYDFYLLEQHRGDGNAMEFLYKVESSLRDLGYRTLWGYVIADNKPARWLYGLRGYKPVRTVVSRRVLGRRVQKRVEG
jgi:GNAT superfamily N-acetyltransferase